MLREELEDKIEDLFHEWQLDLQANQTVAVQYDHYDQSLGTIFLKRTEDFPPAKSQQFQDRVQDEIDAELRVSTIRVPHFS